jgi:predicted metalloprotease with PDZ domain
MTRLRIIFLLLLYPIYATAGDVLTAEFPASLAYVDVSLCFDGRAPGHLYRHKAAGKYSAGIFHDGNRLNTSGNGYSERLPSLPENACINWRTDFIPALKEKDYRLILQRGKDLEMSANLWFWKGPRSRDLLVEIKLPEGMSFSTPWLEIGKTDDKNRYRPDKTSSNWDSRIAIGHFEINYIEVPGARIRLAAIGDLSASQREKIDMWIEETVTTVSSVNGHFPQPQPQVLVIPIGARKRPVVGALVMRGGGLAAEFYIDETRPLREFTADWKATHEFSHMLVPYISSRDRWLSEGLASYYQNVLRARNGRLTETEAWQKLYEGFKRGEKGTHGGSLAQATRSGWRSTMRVYWSGAALMLMADMQLREASGGRQSLDTALKSLSACCMENGKTWRARDMFRQLDQLTNTKIFSQLYEQYVHDDSFPDMQTTWQNLGISTRHDRVSLSEDAPMASVRSSIMKG